MKDNFIRFDWAMKRLLRRLGDEKVIARQKQLCRA